jgi:fructokinase
MNTTPNIVSLGEVLWDLLPSGPQLGGAPANFACHIHSLGANASLVSRVGQDRLGDEALRLLQARGLDLACVTRDPQRPTGTVMVEVGADGQPRFEIVEHVAWDAINATDDPLNRVRNADAICFGSLAQRSPEAGRAIRQLVAAASPDALRIFDINLRAPFYTDEVILQSLELADVLKLNEAELPVLATQFDLHGSVEEQLETLARQFDLDVIALTLGAAGSRLLRNGEWSAEPGRVIAVKDAVGAGDAYTAALVMGLLLNWPTPKLLSAATDIAASVCTQSGATPELPANLRARFASGIRLSAEGTEIPPG